MRFSAGIPLSSKPLISSTIPSSNRCFSLRVIFSLRASRSILTPIIKRINRREFTFRHRMLQIIGFYLDRTDSSLCSIHICAIVHIRTSFRLQLFQHHVSVPLNSYEPTTHGVPGSAEQVRDDNPSSTDSI